MLSSTTPLLALDAVAIDTETTGLDPARACIVQLAGIRISGGRIASGQFVTLVDPGMAIPPQSTAIHGIDSTRVAGAPGFAHAWAGFTAFCGGAVLVGHQVAFDLAVMARQCRTAGISFVPAPSLDTALLAAIADPGRSPRVALETLAGALGVEVVRRHSADGDALTAAGIFVALLPQLRKRGIRTLGEAQAACRSVADSMGAAGHPVPHVPPLLPAEVPLSRIDTFAFSHRCGDLMSAPPVAILAGQPLSKAVAVMTSRRISSLLVAEATDLPPHAIVTERDIMRALAADGSAALARSVAEVASTPLVTVGVDDFAFRAIGRMARHAIRHLAVIDNTGAVAGVLSARDLMRLRSSDAASLGDDVAVAVDPAGLAAALARLPAMARGLLDEGIAATDVAAVISGELGAVTARAGTLAEQQLERLGLGAPPVPYALAVLGSAGRGESLLAPDQDNAVVHADSDDPDVQKWFATFGTHVADILDQAGIPYCKGGVMASNAAWRDSVAGWNRRVGTWIERSSARDLLNVDIFFDLRPVSGEARLTEDVWRNAYQRAEQQIPFLKLLSESTAGFRPPLNLLGGLRTQDGRLDLKAGGLFPIVAGARLLSIRYGIVRRETPARLSGLLDRKIGAEADIERLIRSHELFVDIILRQQIEELAQGVPPSNRIAPSRLTPSRRSDLKAALAHLQHLAAMIRDLLFGE